MESSRLADVTFFAGLGARGLADVAAHATEVRVAQGRRLLLDGAFAYDLMVIERGHGQVRCAGEPVGRLGPGDAFGSLAGGAGAYDTATVAALSDLTLVAFSGCSVRRLRRAAPAVLDALLATAA
jgi:CRP-like cAMP-binding protein